MSMGLIFWILMLLWLVMALWTNWPGNPALPYGPLGNSLLLFILFMLIGWKLWGAPVQG